MTAPIDAARPRPAPVVRVTAEDLREQRRASVDRLGVSLPDLEQRANAFTLTPEESSVWDRCQEIAFLLREDATEGPPEPCMNRAVS